MILVFNGMYVIFNAEQHMRGMKTFKRKYSFLEYESKTDHCYTKIAAIHKTGIRTFLLLQIHIKQFLHSAKSLSNYLS